MKKLLIKMEKIINKEKKILTVLYSKERIFNRLDPRITGGKKRTTGPRLQFSVLE